LATGGILISTNDTTILAMLSRYPNMPVEEADSYISNIEHEDNVAICHAVIGRIPKEQLTSESRRVFDEFYLWSQRRTRRIREEQWTARRRQQETKLALRMNQLHQQGIISDDIMMLYGISGELPDRSMYMEMTPEEKQSVWEERMENRLGPNWRQRFSNRNTNFGILSRTKIEYSKINWSSEGF
jgi:hypothetical protein